jgi:hypothetical protein
MKYFILILLSFLTSLICSQALADECYEIPVLECVPKSNDFLIRFGTRCNKEKLDQSNFLTASNEIEKLWSPKEIAFTNECKLQNNKKISITTKDGQSFAYGAGGADPDTFFSLYVDDKKLYFENKFYKGYGDIGYVLSGISYMNGKLNECNVDENDYPERAEPKQKNNNLHLGVTCKDVSERLNGQSLPAVEQKAFDEYSKRLRLQGAISKQCKDMRKYALESTKIDLFSNEERVPGGWLAEANIDINNDGKIDQIFRVSGGSGACLGAGCGTHYFDGNYIVAFMKGSQKVPKFLNSIRTKETDIDMEPNIKPLPEWSAYFISLGLAQSSPRYVYNVVFSYKNKNYLYVVETNFEKIPPVSISEIKPNGTISTLCKFAD